MQCIWSGAGVCMDGVELSERNEARQGRVFCDNRRVKRR